MVCSSPRASMGLRMFAASMAPSAAPAPTRVWISSMNRDDVAAGADLLEHLLQALLEVARGSGAGHQGAEVEGVELLVGSVSGRCPRRWPGPGPRRWRSCRRRARRSAPGCSWCGGEDLHDPLGLAVATDHRVELLCPGELGEVAAELVEHERPDWAGLAALAGGGAGLLAGPPGPRAPEPDSSWMTCWRTRLRSAPSLTSTWAATPSPSRMRPRRMCSVPM